MLNGLDCMILITVKSTKSATLSMVISRYAFPEMVKSYQTCADEGCVSLLIGTSMSLRVSHRHNSQAYWQRHHHRHCQPCRPSLVPSYRHHTIMRTSVRVNVDRA